MSGFALLAVLTAEPALAQAPAATGPVGPKKRLAVADFMIAGKLSAAFGSTDAGQLLADQFSTLLAESGLFDVVDREDPVMILKEQSATPASASMGQAADTPADLLSAQVIIRASIATFDQKSGGGLSLGIGLGSVGEKSTKTAIGVDIRIVDTTTGRVIGATRVQDAFVDRSMNMSVTRGSKTLSQDAFKSTPTGQATERALRRAIPYIADKLKDVAWTGRIADVDGADAFLNVGSQNGVRVGDVFAISRIDRRIVDPASGEVLGVTETPIGQVKVTEVQERFSRVQGDAALALRRGDVARYVKG